MLSRDVEIGSPVSSILNLGANATLVMTLGDIQKVFVRGKVDEADIGRVRLNQPARIRVETLQGSCVQRPRDADLAARRREGQRHELRSEGLDREPGPGAQGNMTANAEIVLEEHPNALLVPEAAITYDAKKAAFVDVVAPGAKTGRDECRSKSASATARRSKCSTA